VDHLAPSRLMQRWNAEAGEGGKSNASDYAPSVKHFGGSPGSPEQSSSSHLNNNRGGAAHLAIPTPSRSLNHKRVAPYDSRRSYRGRTSVLEQLRSPDYGTTTESSSCTMQLERCEDLCRASVNSCASDYRDPEFPPTTRSLFIDGLHPQNGKSIGAVQWTRARDIVDPATGINGRNYDTSRLMPGSFDEKFHLAVFAALRNSEDPSNLLFVDLKKGAYGCRMYKDGEWIYEILDDFLPCDGTGQLLVGRTSDPHAVWCALIIKAYAKVHGCYESITQGRIKEVFEDLSGFGIREWEIAELPIWGELWHAMRKRHNRGYVSLAMSSEQSAGSLLPGHGYPITSFEKRAQEYVIRFQNVWQGGGHTGKYAKMEENAYQTDFTMTVPEFCKHFSSVVDARAVSPYWQMCSSCFSSEKPAVPLISVTTPGQGVLVISQVDRRWDKSESCSSSLGFRIYRCRNVSALQDFRVGAPSVSSPFQHLELVMTRSPKQIHCVMGELTNMEDGYLYIVQVDVEGASPRINLRWFSSSAMQFRELNSPEASYFKQAQLCASTVERYSFSSTSFDENDMLIRSKEVRFDDDVLIEGQQVHCDSLSWCAARISNGSTGTPCSGVVNLILSPVRYLLSGCSFSTR